MWLKVSSFSDRIMLFVRLSLSLIHGWGASNNPCMIYTLLSVPLHSLQVTYGGTYNAQPLSNA
jgi:hypothetical protein